MATSSASAAARPQANNRLHVVRVRNKLRRLSTVGEPRLVTTEEAIRDRVASCAVSSGRVTGEFLSSALADSKHEKLDNYIQGYW